MGNSKTFSFYTAVTGVGQRGKWKIVGKLVWYECRKIVCRQLWSMNNVNKITFQWFVIFYEHPTLINSLTTLFLDVIVKAAIASNRWMQLKFLVDFVVDQRMTRASLALTSTKCTRSLNEHQLVFIRSFIDRCYRTSLYTSNTRLPTAQNLQIIPVFLLASLLFFSNGLVSTPSPFNFISGF